MSFDGTVPRTLDLHRIKVASRKRDAEYARLFHEADLKRTADSLALVERILGSYEDKPIGEGRKRQKP